MSGRLVTASGKLVRGFLPNSTRFPGTLNQGLGRSTNIPITNYTLCGWVRQWSAHAGEGPVFGLTTTNDNSSPTTYLDARAGSQFALVADGSPGGVPINMFVGAVGIWYFLAVTITTGTTVNLYWYIDGSNAAALSTTSSTLAAGLSCNFFTIGRALGGFCGFDIREQRNWDAVLSSAELFAEAKSLSPARTANLNSWYPFTTTAGGAELTDASGNGNTLTSNATTPTTTAGAPSFMNQDQNLIVTP